MPDKAPIYRINEDLLRQKLLNYQVEVNPARCEAIEQEVASLRFKKSISLPKVNLRIVIPAALIIGVTTLIIFNLDSIKDLFAPAPEVKKIEAPVTTPVSKPVDKPVMQPASPSTVAVQPVQTPSVTNIQAPVENSAVVSKSDTDLAKKNAADNAKKPNPVLAQPPSDSSAKKMEINKQDTSVQRSEAPGKKKKKRRRRNANMEELKESTLQQGGGDDDVVVPQ